MKRIVVAEKGPKPKGAYSQAVVGAGLIFVSGQLAIDPQTGDLVQGDIRAQTNRTLENLASILASEGASLDDVAKVSVFLRNFSDFPEMNAVYAGFFAKDPPARTSVAVADLPAGALIEIDAIALSRDA